MVDIGIHNKNIKESWVQSKIASKVFIHESFNGATFANDIALIMLDVRKFICFNFNFFIFL